MHIELSEPHLVVLKRKCEQFNLSCDEGSKLSVDGFATMIVRDTLASYQSEVTRDITGLQVAAFHQLSSAERDAALKSVRA